MSSTRVLIIAFWVFIGGMLLWQFHNYNQGIEEDAAKQQDHFYFYNTNTANTPQAPPKVVDGPDVQQVAYHVDMNQPGPGSFTCHVTLKNLGTVKAVDLQVLVRPYYGSSRGDPDNPNIKVPSGPIPDSDPLAQLGQSVSFPDLAPGESNTQSVTFIRQGSINPGVNANPQISFLADKPKP